MSFWNRLVPFSEAPKRFVGQEGKAWKDKNKPDRFVLPIARLESILNFGSHSLGNQGLLEAELLFTSLVHHFQRLVKSSKKKLISHLIACTIFLYITLA